VKRFDVEIVDSISDLLRKVDVIMLETNDGRPHLEQALTVLKAGKRLFIDKPVAASLADVLTIYEAARHYQVPVFSASSLRYNAGVQETAAGKTIGKVLGADTFSPSPIEKTQPDFFWYGIHGVEMLCTLMGKGCREVTRTGTEQTDVVVGIWDDGRIGSFRGTRTGQHEYGGTVFGENGIQRIGPYSGYSALLKQIIHFFKTGISPVPAEETLELYAFMEAAHESKRREGSPVSPATVLENAKKNSKKLW
jgi:predicted dehydrogenase